MTLTPYQRGGRDALLAVAAELDVMASRAAADADKWRGSAHSLAQRLLEIAAAGRETAMACAALCRRRAEALPEEPEETWTSS